MKDKPRKNQWTHYGERKGFGIETLCGKKEDHNGAFNEYGAVTTCEPKVTCPRCLEVMTGKPAPPRDFRSTYVPVINTQLAYKLITEDGWVLKKDLAISDPNRSWPGNHRCISSGVWKNLVNMGVPINEPNMHTM